MSKSWKPKLPKAYQPYKAPKPFDPFKIPKEPKQKEFHVITDYERELANRMGAIIRNYNLFKFWYSDTTKNLEDWRIVEPHLIGQLKTTGNIILSAWFLPTPEQFIGGETEKWGNYIIGNISKVEVLSQKFLYTRPMYNRNDSRMSTIFYNI